MIKLMGKRALILSALLTLCVTSSAWSQELRIGYLNPQTVLERLPDTGKIEKELGDLAKKKQEEFSARVQKFQNDVQRFQNNASLMQADAKEKEESRLISEEQELQKLQSDIQQELGTKRNELLRPVLQKIDTAISEVAKELSLTYVMNESTSQGESILLFVSENGKKSFDITEKVIAKLIK